MDLPRRSLFTLAGAAAVSAPGGCATATRNAAPATVTVTVPADIAIAHSIRANAELSRDQIMRSPQLAEFLGSGALQVVAGYYSLHTGLVTVI